MPQINYQKICQKVLEGLAQRQRTVIERRFGLQKPGPSETLERIGQDFGVTRERIRQIENDGFLKLKKSQAGRTLQNTFAYFAGFLKKEGGVKREDILLADLGGKQFQNYVYFLLHLGEPFHRFPETEAVYPFWTVEKGLARKVQHFIATILNTLQKKAKPLPQDKLLPSSPRTKILLACLDITKQVEKGPLGDFGLVDWPEIKPRGMRDKAYLALQKQGRPLHFREITLAINQLPNFLASSPAQILRSKTWAGKEAQPQTVHNELIKDERFVLVGRGVYGLKEWGYQQGTVQDVIADILKRAKKPLSQQAVVKQVLSQRLVKPNTVLLNLNNKDYFSKDSQGRYTLKA